MRWLDWVNLEDGWRAGAGVAHEPQDKMRRRGQGETEREVCRHISPIERGARRHVDGLAEAVAPVASDGAFRLLDRLAGFKVDDYGFFAWAGAELGYKT